MAHSACKMFREHMVSLEFNLNDLKMQKNAEFPNWYKNHIWWSEDILFVFPFQSQSKEMSFEKGESRNLERILKNLIA